MLNENQKFEKKESKGFVLLKNDIYQVELVDINKEEKTKYQSTEIEEVLSFEFAVLAGKDAEGNDARTRLLSKNFVPTYLYISSKKGKNWLYKVVEALIGRDLTKEEEANGITGKTLNYLVGKQCRVLLEKTASKKDPEKFYSNISNILPSDADLTPLSADEKKKIEEYKPEKATQVVQRVDSQEDNYPVEEVDFMGEEINPSEIQF